MTERLLLLHLVVIYLETIKHFFLKKA